MVNQMIKKEILTKIIFENLLKNGKVTLEEAEFSEKLVDKVVDSVFNEVAENLQVQFAKQNNENIKNVEESTQVKNITSKLNKLI